MKFNLEFAKKLAKCTGAELFLVIGALQAATTEDEANAVVNYFTSKSSGYNNPKPKYPEKL